jgi:ADP-ribose pyrophosphatase YjhB (NUDIX family)
MSLLAAFLAQHAPAIEEIVHWDDLRLRVTSYRTARTPPLAFVTSVRALVLHGSSVILVHAPDGTHILPGGRREEGEALTDTLMREVLEETGWTIDQLQMLGIKHYHHLTPMPPEYLYPYPDFVQIVYRARAQQFLPEAREIDGYELETKFIPTTEALQLPLMPSDHMWLRAALG